MADRHQNINISYNVRSDDLGKVEQQARRAEEATRKLEQSAVSVGQKGSSSNRAYIRSIESIKVEMQRTRQLIDLTNRADTKLLNQRIAKYRQLKKELQDFNRQVEGSGRAAKRASTGFFNLGNIIGTVFSIHVLRRVGQLALDMAELQGKAEGVGRAFRRAIPDADLLLRRLRESTHGTVSDLTLMQRTLRAANLGIPVRDFGTLLEFATLRAQQTGESIDYLVDSIVTGLGRKSTRVIDNLGISVVRVKEALGGVSLEAASVGEVTAAVVRIANEEIEKMGEFHENNATKIQQMGVEWEKFKISLATTDTGIFSTLTDGALAFSRALRNLAENGFSGFADGIRDQKVLSQAIKDAKIVTDEASKSFEKDSKERAEFIDNEIKKRQQTIEQYKREQGAIQQLLKIARDFDAIQMTGLLGFATGEDIARFTKLRGEFEKLHEATFGYARQLDKHTIPNLENLSKGHEINADILKATIELLKEYLTVQEDVDGEIEKQLGLIQEVKKEIEETQRAFDTSRSQSEMDALNKKLFVLQGRLHDLQNIGLPEFKSPEVLERVGKVIDEKIKKGFEESNKELLNMEAVLDRLSGRIVPIEVKVDEIQFMDSWDKILTSIEENWRDLTTAGIGIFSDFLIGSREAELESYQQRLDALGDFYDEQITLAGDNERAKAQLELQEKKRTDALRKEQARKEKDARRYQIIVDTAAALARVWIQPGFPLAVALTPLIIANAAQQLSVLNKAQPRGFFKGEIGIDGPGTPTSDSIPAKLSKGESVINAEATRKSRGLLEAINARKLDDRVLQELQLSRPSVNVSGMDPGPIVEAIRAQKQTDVMSIGRTMFVAHNATATHKRYVRTKIMGKFSR